MAGQNDIDRLSETTNNCLKLTHCLTRRAIWGVCNLKDALDNVLADVNRIEKELFWAETDVASAEDPQTREVRLQSCHTQATALNQRLSTVHRELARLDTDFLQYHLGRPCLLEAPEDAADEGPRASLRHPGAGYESSSEDGSDEDVPLADAGPRQDISGMLPSTSRGVLQGAPLPPLSVFRSASSPSVDFLNPPKKPRKKKSRAERRKVKQERNEGN